jgi:2,5-diketo-D-gluconate reductase B
MTRLPVDPIVSPIDAGPVPLRRLGGGAAIPALGFGTWELREATTAAVRHALATGYRHIDTARAYQNEAAIGAALASSGLARGAYWITSKAWRDDLSAAGIRRQAEHSLRDLNIDYLDLFLVHWPNQAFELTETLGAFQQLACEGKIRYFGVSNFTAGQWQAAMAIAPEMITNQVEYHPLLDQGELSAALRGHAACLTAYAPLARGTLFDPGRESARVLAGIAAAHGKTPQQVALRWLIEQPAVVAIPGSRNPRHIEENFAVFDFELGAEERARIERLACGERLVHPGWAPAEWQRA